MTNVEQLIIQQNRRILAETRDSMCRVFAGDKFLIHEDEYNRVLEWINDAISRADCHLSAKRDII